MFIRAGRDSFSLLMVALALATLEEETPSLRPEEWTTHSQDLLYDNQESHANTVFTNDFDETGN